VARRLTHVAKSSPICPQGVVIEIKNKINHWLGGHTWPPLNTYFHPPLHLAPIMLTPLTKSIKSKANSFHPFPKFYLFIVIIILKFLILYYAMMN
jgi:hypothetical protein